MLTFTSVTWADAGPLYVWRHDPETVKWSIHPPPTWEEHLVWLNQIISSRREWIWVGRMFPIFPRVPVVCVSSIDGEVNVTVNPYYRNQGVGTKAIQHLQSYNEPLKATINIDNEVSIRLFAKCNFHQIDQEKKFILLEWTP